MATVKGNTQGVERDLATGSGEDEREVLAEFGRRIVRLRQKKGWSQVELARRLGLTRERLGHWERGKHNPPLKALLALRRVLEIPMEELISGEETPTTGLSPRKKAAAVSYLAALMRLLR